MSGATVSEHADRPLFRVLAAALHEAGVDVTFGVMGEDTAALTVGIIEHGITYLGARHEAAAVGMADGYAWASGELGVCMVTRGPGLMNAMNSLRSAVHGGRTVLAIIGDAPTNGENEWDYKYIDQRPLADAIGLRYFTAADVEGALSQFEAALASAREGAAAVLAIPADVFLHAVPDGLPQTAVAASVAADPAPAPPDAAVIAELAELLSGARAPLILAGAGARPDGVPALLTELATRTGAMLGTTLLAKDLFRGHPNDIGVVGGFASDPAVPLLADVDLVLSFGARLTPHTTGQRTLFRGATVVQVDRDPASIGVAFDVTRGVVADAGETARALLDALDGQGAGRTAPRAVGTPSELLYDGPDESNRDGLDPRIVATTLDRLLPSARTIVLDSGRFMTSPARFIRVPGPDSFRLSVDAGSIGQGLGIALGVAFARAPSSTVLFVGDGGMSMSLADLETAARHQLPLIVVVMNDSAYGSEWVHLRGDGLPVSYAHLPTMDFAAVAAALGIESASVSDRAGLDGLATRLRDRTSPLLIDCRIRSDLTAARLRWPTS